jgi:ectoine hydroxylase-related dioxygenase (phytanoyl-CoA dioxygenase family)
MMRLRHLLASNRLLGFLYSFLSLTCCSCGTFAFLTGGAIRRCAKVSLSEVAQPQVGDDQQQPTFGLYQVQEKLIVDRGTLEEELMANMYMPLQANKPKVRGVGKSGGFGGGTNKASSAGLKAEGKAHAKVLKDDGVVRIDSVLSDSVTDELREFVFKLKQEAEESVAAGTVTRIHRFADVLLRSNRCDLTMPLGPDIITKALIDALLKSPVRYTIENLLGKNAVLYELSCLISYPGSQRQVVHPDTPYGAMGGLAENEPVLYTCFIALQDIHENMGPTVWLPGTHTKDAHDRFKDEQGEQSPKDQLLRTTPAKLGMLPKGSCGIFDSRLLHCGGANRSLEDSRALFYFSFKNPKIGYPGNPGSIRPELVSKLSLNALCNELEQYVKGEPCPQLEALAATLK